MKHSAPFVIALILALSTQIATAQTEPLKVRVKPEDVKNITQVELESNGKVFPKSLLYKTERTSMIILPGTIQDDRGRQHFMQKEVMFDDVDYITIHNRKRKIRSSIIGGVIGGVACYFIADQLGDKQLRQPSIELLGQAPETRIVEPIAMGFLGAGIGVILGEMLSPIRLSTADMSKREIQQRLKQFSYR
ncbi:MAG: hypothetical protein R3301_15730 [Saprospiraceae bacterium]|nr:hypothetical protein [Saprospiraceae bacterium]